ncbi:hypothetical protein pb186bvf_011874 [Paramecium bursaria]
MQNFKRLDLFGSVFTLNINRNDKEFRSIIGGITSFLLYSCSLAYFIYKIYLWSSGLIQPNINSQSTSFDYQEYAFQTPPIGINMFTSQEDPFDPQNNYVTFLYLQFDGFNASEPQVIKPQIKNLNGQSSFIEPQNVHLVLNPTDQKQNGLKTQMKGTIYVAFCDEKLAKYNITCASDDKLQSFISKFQQIIIWITVHIYNTETKQIQTIVQQVFFQLDLYAPFVSQIQFKVTELDVDDNIFISTSETSKYISSCNIITQPLSQTIIKNSFGIQGFGIFMISLSSDGNISKIAFPKLGQILADVGSIMSTLLSISIIAQLINSYLLEEQILYQIISLYFPDIKNYEIKKNYFGKIVSVQVNNKSQDIQQYQVKFEIMKEKARNKITFINQIYEMSRLQFILQSLVDKQVLINSHKLGIKWVQNEEESNQQIVNAQEFQIEDFTILSLESLDKQDDIKFQYHT